MKPGWLIFLILMLCGFNSIYSQNRFEFDAQEKRAVTLKFESLNNLIILPAMLNGEYIKFLVDTGVNKTKVFAQPKDSSLLENAEYISMRSLGSPEPVKGYKTLNNTIDFGPITGKNQEVYYITDPRFDLAGKLGINVQGIMGYELFKDFIIRLNYDSESLRLYQREKFNRKLRRFDKIEFRLIRNKPHIKSPIKFLNGSEKELVFLLDTGSSDAFWLFEDEDVPVPENAFTDYVGYGLELAIEGQRTKFQSAQIGNYELQQPRVAYIDSLSSQLFTADRFKDGIIGSEILRRFVWFFDYESRTVYLKSNRNFDDTTNYDRSGLILLYVGDEVTRTRVPIMVRVDEETNYNSFNPENRFEIRLQIAKILKVAQIRPRSPAAGTDIQIGDRILKLNGKTVNKMSLEDINTLLSSEEGKLIKIQLERAGKVLKRELFLSSQLNDIPGN
ncbi:PDZ domain-containing protein [Psychroflexus sp. YR1-1]|uniref:PDZ domain-containing protein n=2 Tax=Psychroflexus aurantiacus TaxID=2709310 RepID=A0A6B3R1F2_9FLAO|nr:PDZ domain-containing protein [Psychroflexus aurantiacus]